MLVVKPHRQVDNQDGDVGEKPRQRRRVLDKRNPLATEYQSIGDIGTVTLSDVDSEGIDNRARFPFTAPFAGSGRTATGEISYNYNELSGRGLLQGKASYGQVVDAAGRWAVSFSGERTGVAHSFERARMRWRLREVEARSIFFLNRLRVSRNTIRSVRNRVNLSLDYQPGEHHRLYFKTQIEERNDEESDQRLRLTFGQGEVEFLDERSALVRHAVAERSVRDFSEHRNVRRFLAGGEHEGKNSRFDYSVYSARWLRNEVGNLNPVFRLEGVDYAYSLADPAFPEVTVRNDKDLNDLSQFSFDEYTLRDVATTDRDFAFQVNHEKRFRFDDLSGVLHTGAVYRSKERVNDYAQSAVDGFGGVLDLDRVAGAPVGRVVRDHYDFGAGVNPDAMRALIAGESDRFLFNPGRSRVESDTSNYTASESVAGAYLLQSLGNGHWQLRGGVRIESTRLATAGNLVLTDVQGDYVSTEPVAGAISYTHWLPSLAFELELNERMKVNAAWFRTLARPNYFDLVPYRRISANFQFIAEGNPNLRPTRFDHFLVATHIRNEAVGNLSIAGYYKRLEAFFYESDVFIAGGQFDGWTRSRTENGNDATLWGVEFGWQRTVRFLPTSVGELSLTAFYTFSETSADVVSRPGEGLPLPERSRHFAALSANHRLGPFATTVSINYQSAFLDEIGDTPGMDEFVDDSVGINLAFNLNLATGIQCYVRLSNLIDRPERSFEGVSNRVSDNQYGSWKAVAGLRFTL